MYAFAWPSEAATCLVSASRDDAWHLLESLLAVGGKAPAGCWEGQEDSLPLDPQYVLRVDSEDVQLLEEEDVLLLEEEEDVSGVGSFAG